MEDKLLIRMIHEKPEEGMKQAMKQYGPLVKSVVIKIIGYDHPEDVNDCMADVFFKLWRYIKNYDPGKRSLKGYIAMIARNEAFRRVRMEHRHPEGIDINEIEIGVEVDMVNEVGKKINAKLVQKVVDELPEPDRQIFISRFFWGKRIKEIAAQMQLEDKFIENRLYLVKRKLKEKLITKGVIL